MRFFSLPIMILMCLSGQNGLIDGYSMGDAAIGWVVTLAYLGWCFDRKGE